MKAESAKFILQARICIGRADTMSSVGLNEDAGRAAYLACFHAAEAHIFESTAKFIKSHHGVQTEFFRLTKDDSRVDPVLRRFLSQSYEFKSVADYFTESFISAEQAAGAIYTARLFVAHVETLLREAPNDY